MRPELIPAVFLTWAVLMVLLFVRNHVASSISMKALDALRSWLHHEIKAGRADFITINTHFDRLARVSYYALLFDLRVWTPKQAYPWLYELIDGRRAA